jgi:hypothetical protein
MVLDLGKDYYHLSGQALTDLSGKVKAGNMEDVLRVYESEMKVCVFLVFWRRARVSVGGLIFRSGNG